MIGEENMNEDKVLTNEKDESESVDNLKKSKSRKKIVISVGTLAVIVIAIFIVVLATSNGRYYNKALNLYNNEDYVTAYELFIKLDEYKDSTAYAEKCKFYIKINELSTDKNYEEAVTYIKDSKDVFNDEEKYKTLLDEYRYLLAEQQYKEKSYVDAFDNLKDNEYDKASALLKKVTPLYKSEEAVDEILEIYQSMSDWLDNLIDKGSNYYEKQMIINSGADWDAFYINRGSAIAKLKDSLETKTVEECSSQIKDIIGYLPKTKKECNKILDELQKVFITKGGFKDYNGYYLPFVMTYITASDKYVKKTRDDSEGTITINQVDKYLKEKHISAKTFAYMLGIPTMYKMSIEKQNDSLKLTFPEYSHNYAYCDVGNDEKRNKEIEAFLKKADDETKYLYSSNGYYYYELNLSGINKLDLDYLRLTYIATEGDDLSVILSQDHHYLDKTDLQKADLRVTFKLSSENEYGWFYWVCDYS